MVEKTMALTSAVNSYAWYLEMHQRQQALYGYLTNSPMQSRQGECTSYGDTPAFVLIWSTYITEVCAPDFLTLSLLALSILVTDHILR